MQYLLHDIIKLPLADRLALIETVLTSMADTDPAIGLTTLTQQLNIQKEQNLNNKTIMKYK